MSGSTITIRGSPRRDLFQVNKETKIHLVCNQLRPVM